MFLLCLVVLNHQLEVFGHKPPSSCISWRDRIDHLLHDIIAESMTSSFLPNLHWSGIGDKQPGRLAYASRCRHRQSLQNLTCTLLLHPIAGWASINLGVRSFHPSMTSCMASTWRHTKDQGLCACAGNDCACAGNDCACAFSSDYFALKKERR